MNYINAADILPEYLLNELQNYAGGQLMYIPSAGEGKKWGEKNGTKQYYENRNKQIRDRYHRKESIEQIALDFGLAYETVRKIVYKGKMER